MAAQLLLFAEPLLREGLTQLLQNAAADYRVASDSRDLDGRPNLVIWHPGGINSLAGLSRELELLRNRWQPAPLLLLLPAGQPLTTAELLPLPVAGLLEAPEPAQLLESVASLLAGGRVLALADAPPDPLALPPGLALGQRLLLQGLGQIDAELDACRWQLSLPSSHPLQQLVWRGRLRELQTARRLLTLVWGPLPLDNAQPTSLPMGTAPGRIGTQLILPQPSADGIWQSLRSRLESAARSGLNNQSGQLLALEGLTAERRCDLLLALLAECDGLRQRLVSEQLQGKALQERWNQLQLELRQQALRATVSSYVQLPREGELLPVAENLIRACELAGNDPELPDPLAMVATLVHGQPLLVDGVLVPADEPLAVLHLEQLLSNWLVRSAELISSEVLACCAGWPELRRYLLQPEHLATRSLERLRNQLNAQQRWSNWWERPVALYESRRSLFCLQAGAIATINLTEPRDLELRQLGWLQQLVTLALESRDALAPQLHSLLKGIGDLLVVVLTQVLGRSIGLVGRGIRQGLGRSFSRG